MLLLSKKSGEYFFFLMGRICILDEENLKIILVYQANLVGLDIHHLAGMT